MFNVHACFLIARLRMFVALLVMIGILSGLDVTNGHPGPVPNRMNVDPPPDEERLSKNNDEVKTTVPPPLPTGPPDADGPYQNAVVAADAGQCSEIGRDILQRGGSAVDGAVATMFCIGVMNMHSAGIGGGGFMVVYNRAKKFSEVFDFREEAPTKAHRDMYINSSLSSRVGM